MSEARILVVDDEPAITVALAKRLRREGYECLTASSGREAMARLAAAELDLVVADVRMPGMSGIELLKEIKNHDPDIQVIMMTAYTDISFAIEALRNKADDYLLKPFNLAELSHSVARSLEHRRLLREVQTYRETVEQGAGADLADSERASRQGLAALASAVESRDRHTRGHLGQVGRYAVAVGAEFSLGDDGLRELWLGAVLHDVGMLVVPEAVINKPGPLTSEEWRQVREHPAAGARIVDAAPYLRPARDGILHHHERWDGSGYPAGLAASKISRAGSIIAVADAFAAMQSDRPYRGALSEAEALSEIAGGAGSRFDQEVVRAFHAARDKGFPIIEVELEVPEPVD